MLDDMFRLASEAPNVIDVTSLAGAGVQDMVISGLSARRLHRSYRQLLTSATVIKARRNLRLGGSLWTIQSKVRPCGGYSLAGSVECPEGCGR